MGDGGFGVLDSLREVHGFSVSKRAAQQQGTG
jgi:hypothetical protein